MPRGFECGNGWFEIIYRLSEQLSKIDSKRPIEEKQVKQKFGTLRFLVNERSEEMSKLIFHAIEQASITCESCGKKVGKLHTDKGKWALRCDDCTRK